MWGIAWIAKRLLAFLKLGCRRELIVHSVGSYCGLSVSLEASPDMEQQDTIRPYVDVPARDRTVHSIVRTLQGCCNESVA